MKKVLFVILLLAAVAAGGGYIYQFKLKSNLAPKLILYGNIEDRSINLAFIITERIKDILVEEGAEVKTGELLATLDTVRIQNTVDSAKAALEASNQNYLKAKNGPRKEEIDVSKSELTAAEAALEYSKTDHSRYQELIKNSASSQQLADSAKAKYLSDKASLEAARSRLNELLAGSRDEDIAAAAAQVEEAKVQLAVALQQLADTKLYAPRDGIVRKRLLEVGEMASPSTPVFSIALVNPKWVRAYLSEAMLVQVKEGAPAKVTVDGRSEPFEGWVGYISPSAEFTPKNIETPELRTSLMYEVRIMLKDPQNLLKLGSPATVELERQ